MTGSEIISIEDNDTNNYEIIGFYASPGANYFRFCTGIGCETIIPAYPSDEWFFVRIERTDAKLLDVNIYDSNFGIVKEFEDIETSVHWVDRLQLGHVKR